MRGKEERAKDGCMASVLLDIAHHRNLLDHVDVDSSTSENVRWST